MTPKQLEQEAILKIRLDETAKILQQTLKVIDNLREELNEECQN